MDLCGWAWMTTIALTPAICYRYEMRGDMESGHLVPLSCHHRPLAGHKTVAAEHAGIHPVLHRQHKALPNPKNKATDSKMQSLIESTQIHEQKGDMHNLPPQCMHGV